MLLVYCVLELTPWTKPRYPQFHDENRLRCRQITEQRSGGPAERTHRMALVGNRHHTAALSVLGTDCRCWAVEE